MKAAFAFGLVAMGLVACESTPSTADDDVSLTSTEPSSSAKTPAAPDATAVPAPVPVPVPVAPLAGACPADVPVATQLAASLDATDLQVVGGRLYFRSGRSLERVNLDGTGAVHLSSGDPRFETRYFVDSQAILAVASGGGCMLGTRTPMRLDGSLTGTASTMRFCPNNGGLSGAGVRIFGGDLDRYYFMDASLVGTSLSSVDPSRLEMQFLATQQAALTDPIVSSRLVFWVDSGRNVMRLDSSFRFSTPRQVATAEGCRLAVGTTNVFCATPSALLGFDASGLQRTVLDVATSKVPSSPLGAATADGDVVFVQSAAPTADALKNVLREVRATTPAFERLLACGRETIGSVAFDATRVVFAETGRGVFVVNR